MPSSTSCKLVFLYQDGVGDAEFGEMVLRTATNNSSTDDDNIGISRYFYITNNVN